MADTNDWHGLQALVERKLRDASTEVKHLNRASEFAQGFNLGREAALDEIYYVMKEVSENKARIRLEEGTITIYRTTANGIVVDITKATAKQQ